MTQGLNLDLKPLGSLWGDTPSGVPLALLEQKLLRRRGLLIEPSALKAPLAPLGAASSKPLWLQLDRRLLLELFWLLWS